MKKILTPIGNFFKSVGITIATILVALSGMLYIQCEVYSFQPQQPFSGSHWFNPYSDSSSNWLKANFHAHSIAWGHLTNGHQEPEVVQSEYARMGYDIACLSNYHKVTRGHPAGIDAFPVYEHGFNVSKTHQLVIEPNRVSFFDLPFYQSVSMKQSVLNALSDEGSCVVLNHPLIRNGYTDEDLKTLTGYHLIEVLNHTVNSTTKWDVALSAGKPVWCIGNDDLHDARKKSELGVCWTMVSANGESPVEQLKQGNAYGVQGKEGRVENALTRLQVRNDTLHLQLDQPAKEIRFIGQHGQVRQVVYHSNAASYTLTNLDTYIRTEVIQENSSLFLNPVIRYDGQGMPVNASTASIHLFGTVVYRIMVGMATVVLLGFLHQRPLRRFLDALRSIRLTRRRRRQWGFSFVKE